MMVTFAESHWLWLIPLFALGCLGIAWQASHQRKKSLAALSGGRDGYRPSDGALERARHRNSLYRRPPAGSWLRELGLLPWVLCLLAVALARPQLGFEERQVRFTGLDIVVAVDVSRSMMAQDLSPSRLKRAQLALEIFAEQRAGDRLGLIAFTGQAFLQCPPTLDRGAFRESLRALEPGMVPGGGTNLLAALQEATSALPGDLPQRAVVILTDGEDTRTEQAVLARFGAESGLAIFTVGVGTAAGSLIPDGRGDVVRDATGQPVVSRLNSGVLVELASATGGLFAPLGVNGEGLERIGAALNRLQGKTEEALNQRTPREHFAWPLALAALLLLAEGLFAPPFRRHPASLPDGPESPPATPRKREDGSNLAASLLCVLAVTLFGIPAMTFGASGSLADRNPQGSSPAPAEPPSPAEIAFPPELTPHLEAAAAQPLNARAHFNLGTAKLTTNDPQVWATAASDFRRAIELGDRRLQSRALFNLGILRSQLALLTDPERNVEAGRLVTLDPKLAEAEAVRLQGERIYEAATEEIPELLRAASPPSLEAIKSALAAVSSLAMDLGTQSEMLQRQRQSAIEQRAAWEEVAEAFSSSAYLDPQQATKASENRRWAAEQLDKLPGVAELNAAAAALSQAGILVEQLSDLAERLRELLPPEERPENASERGEGSEEQPDEGSSEGENDGDRAGDQAQQDAAERGENGPGRQERSSDPADHGDDGDPSQGSAGEREGESDRPSASDSSGQEDAAADGATQSDNETAEDRGTSESEDGDSPEDDSRDRPSSSGDSEDPAAGADSTAGDAGAAGAGAERATGMTITEAEGLLDEWERRGVRLLPMRPTQGENAPPGAPEADW